MICRAQSIVFPLMLSSLLTGCVAAPMLVGAVRLNNHVNPDQTVTVTIDPEGSGRLKSMLSDVKHLAVLAKSTAAIGFADAWESAGKQASIISGVDPASVSLSQAQSAMASACTPGVQAATYARMTGQDMNRVGMLIGRGDATLTGNLFLYRCDTKTLGSAPISIALNAVGQTPEQTDRTVGAMVAGKLLELTKP